MDFSELKINNNSLSEWLVFPLNLGHLLKKYSNTHRTAFNLYISIPNSIMFTYLLFQGMFDTEAHRRIRDNKIINRFLELESGSIVYYDDNGIWRRCSVIDIVKNFTSNQKYHLHLQLNQKVSHYVPVDTWKEKLIITNLKHDEILNARVIKDFEKFSGVLSSLYSPKTIKNLEILNQPTAYLTGNKTEFERYLNSIEFEYKNIQFTHADIIHFNSNKHFSNAKWMTSKEIDLPLDTSEWLISLGASRSITSLNRKNKCGNIFIEDHFENAATTELLRDSIMGKIILEERHIFTNDLIELLETEDIIVPNGVSLIAWK